MQSPIPCCVLKELRWVRKAQSPGEYGTRINRPAGIRQTRNTTTFVHLLVRIVMIFFAQKFLFSAVHAVIKAGYLVAITVEHLRGRVFEVPRQPNFPRLAPAGMIDLRIHVRIEAIFGGACDVPCRRRLYP